MVGCTVMMIFRLTYISIYGHDQMKPVHDASPMPACEENEADIGNETVPTADVSETSGMI